MNVPIPNYQITFPDSLSTITQLHNQVHNANK